MKLIYFFILRISLALTVVLTVWAVMFYIAVMDEVDEEVDDVLEDYSEVIILRALVGEELPSHDSGSGHQYFLRQVSEDYAHSRSSIAYGDTVMYIPDKREMEPVRTLTTIFHDCDDAHWELTVSAPTLEKDDLREAMANWVVNLYVIMLVLIILISVWVFYRNMRPLYVLLQWLDRYTIGGHNEPLHNNTSVSEFRKLNEAAVRYAERSEHLFDQQKQFIGNASHEMQTPLAICQSRIEMLMEDETLSEAQLEELAKTHLTLDHLAKLNKTLLLLSKIENGQFSDTTPVDANELLKRYLQDFSEAYAYRHITVSLDERGTFRPVMNETLAVTLLTNLLKNAFVHNVEGGEIRITLTRRGVTFANTAEGEPLDTSRIFNRFYQGTKKEGSTGLGLAIADTICKMQPVSLRYFYRKGWHCFFVGGK